jgi:hypothetical protein
MVKFKVLLQIPRRPVLHQVVSLRFATRSSRLPEHRCLQLPAAAVVSDTPRGWGYLLACMALWCCQPAIEQHDPKLCCTHRHFWARQLIQLLCQGQVVVKDAAPVGRLCRIVIRDIVTYQPVSPRNVWVL